MYVCVHDTSFMCFASTCTHALAEPSSQILYNAHNPLGSSAKNVRHSKRRTENAVRLANRR